jgi:hypothetical protein
MDFGKHQVKDIPDRESMMSYVQTGETPFYSRAILALGSVDWSSATFGTLRQVFYAIFLTDVVGLEPQLASPPQT